MGKIYQHLFTGASVALVLAFSGPEGCSPRNSSSRARSQELRAQSPLEQECGRELLDLDTLIENKRRDRSFPAAVLAEAIELRRAAGELFLSDDFELALDLIDEAISLLKGTG